MARYDEFSRDRKYCYPGSFVLKNKLNILDEKQLDEAERNLTALRLLELRQNPLQGLPNFSYFLKMHRYVFQDIYSWAGEIRNVDMAKGSLFCKSLFIVPIAETIFENLKKENYLLTCPADALAERLAYYLSEINAIHPFREGNGRIQRAFIEVLANICGIEVDFSEVTSEEMISASQLSFVGRYEKMNELFARVTVPITAAEQADFIERLTGKQGPLYDLFLSLTTKA